MQPKILIALALAPMLAACGSSTKSTPPPPTKTVVRAPVRHAPPAALIKMVPGLEGVLGATGNDLERQFGPARLEVIEGDARKLQFSGAACVLDVYLYPLAQSREPLASYVEARRASDGQDVDRVACVGALRKH